MQSLVFLTYVYQKLDPPPPPLVEEGLIKMTTYNVYTHSTLMPSDPKSYHLNMIQGK